MNPDQKNPLSPEPPDDGPTAGSQQLQAPELIQTFELPAPVRSTTPSDGAAPESSSSVPAAPYLQEDLRVPWGWTDLLLLVGVTISGAIVLIVLLAMGLAAFGVNIRHLQDSATANLAAVGIQAVLDLGVLAFLGAQMRLRFRLPFWRTIGWGPLETDRMPRWLAYLALVAGGAVLAILVTLASAIWPPKGELPIQQILQDRHTMILFALMAVFIAPVVEETLFRGYLYPVVARSFGVTTGIIATGTIFGLLHAGQLSGGYWQIALLVIVGILFTFVRARTRTVTASYLLHISYNSLQVIALLVDTHGFRQLPSLH